VLLSRQSASHYTVCSPHKKHSPDLRVSAARQPWFSREQISWPVLFRLIEPAARAGERARCRRQWRTASTSHIAAPDLKSEANCPCAQPTNVWGSGGSAPSSLISAIDGCGHLHAPRRFTPRESFPDAHWIRTWVGLRDGLVAPEQRGGGRK
jgi:hypothetical protein